jgi:tetratricopeptide (TPR) repeat protein
MESLNLRRKERFWNWVVVVAPLLFLVTLVGGGYLWYWHSGPEPPSVPHEGLEPAVAAAIDAGRQSVLRHPRSWTAWGHLGKVLLAHKFPEEARLCFVQAEYLDSKEPRWPYFQGIILSLTDNSAAIAKFQRAADLCPYDEPDSPRLKLAETLIEQGESPEAKKQFDLLLHLESATYSHDPSHALAHLGLARLALERNDWKETLAHLEKAKASPYSRKAAHALLASYYQMKGDAVSAENELRIVAQLPGDLAAPDPFNGELIKLRVDKRSRFKKATQLLAEKRLTEAAEALQKLVEEFPDMDMAWRILGRTQLQMGDLPGAEYSLKTALRLHPDSVEGQYYLGLLSLTRKKYEVAKSYFQRAIELKPDYALAHYQLARCFSEQGERAHAIQELQTALHCQPFLAEAHRDLGELLALTGQAKEAGEHLRQAVELDPTDEKAQKILEKLKNLSGGRKPPERE